MEIVLGDDNIVRVVGVGTLPFDRGPKPPLKVSDVIYVSRMKKNLISVSALDPNGIGGWPPTSTWIIVTQFGIVQRHVADTSLLRDKLPLP